MLSLTRTRACAYTLTLALVLSVLGNGAIDLPVLAAYVALVIGSGLLASSLGQGPSAGGLLPREAVGASVFFGLALFCLLQALPVPLGWLQQVAASNGDIWSRSVKPFGLPAPEFVSVSLAPRRTLIEAVQVASYGVVFAVSARLSRKLGLRWLTLLAFGSALALALVTAAHQVVGAERLYGLYRPMEPYNVAPLLNLNNRAGYLNLGFFCGLGLLFRTGARPLAVLIGFGLAFLAAEVLLCESVGGTGSLALGLLLVLALPRGGTRPGNSLELSRPVQAGILILIGLGATFMALAARHTELGLNDRSIEKIDLIARSWRLALDHFWLGVGRGAFGAVFTAYQAPGPHFIFEHAENFPLQWAAEWGVPVTVIALLSLAWVVKPTLSRRTLGSPTRRCALVGCGVLLLQNLVDLGLEIPAVSALLCCVLGALCGAAADAQQSANAKERRPLLWAGSALTGVCLVLALTLGIESPGRMRRELYTQLSASRPAPTPAFWAALRGAVEAYPADPYFPLLGSSAALAAGQNAIPWISRALERKPTSAQAHLQLGRILQARGASSQAGGALRRAIELEPEQLWAVLRLGKEWHWSTAAMEGAAPDGAAGATYVYRLAGQTEAVGERLRLLEQAVRRDPTLADAHYQLAYELVQDLARKQAGSACADQRDSCLARAADHAKRGHKPGDARTGILQARILVEQGRPLEAEDHLANTCEHVPGDPSCGDALVAQALANDSPRLSAAVKGLVATACSNRERCGQTHLHLGHKFANAGQLHIALSHYRHAAEEIPSAEVWHTLAMTAERLGQEAVAADARRRKGLLEAVDARLPVPPPVRAAEPSPHPAPLDQKPAESNNAAQSLGEGSP